MSARRTKTASKDTPYRMAKREAAAASGYTPTSKTLTAKKKRRRTTTTTRLCDYLYLRAAATSPPQCEWQVLRLRRCFSYVALHPRIFLAWPLASCWYSRDADILWYLTLQPTCFYILWIFINQHQDRFDAVTPNCRPCRRLLSIVDELALRHYHGTIFAFLCHMPYSIEPRGQCDVCVHVHMSMFVLFCSSPRWTWTYISVAYDYVKRDIS